MFSIYFTNVSYKDASYNRLENGGVLKGQCNKIKWPGKISCLGGKDKGN
jgi:hypothetical protein